MGCDLNSATAVQHYIGTLDEIELYDRAFAEDEIKALATR